MTAFNNLFAAPSANGTLKFQNGAYLNNSLTAGLQAIFGFRGVLNGQVLVQDPRYLRKVEATYVNPNDTRDTFVVNWNVDNRTSSMGTPVNFSPLNARVTGLDDADDAGVYRLAFLRLEDYWAGKSSNVKFQNYAFPSSPFSLTLLKAPDYTYQLSGPLSVAEGNSAEFTITRVGATGFNSVVYFSTAAGTATASSDFAAMNKLTVTFGDNETSKVIRVKTVVDMVAESVETFSGQLFAKQADATPVQQVQVGITNTEPTFAYTVTANGPATEGAAVSFRIDRTGTIDLPSTVFVATASGTATTGVDFVALPRTEVRFAAGAASTTVQVSTRVDLLTEGQESFALQLFSAASSPSPVASGTGLINNRDAINLTGTASPDVINGNEFDNVIAGLGGGDTLSGGAGRDIFRYFSLLDSGTTPLAMDKILDFRKGEDKIDLSPIDANGALSGDQGFVNLISVSAPFTQPGQMKINHNGNFNYTVFLNTNNTPIPEAAIQVQLVGVPSGNPTGLTFSDFIA